MSNNLNASTTYASLRAKLQQDDSITDASLEAEHQHKKTARDLFNSLGHLFAKQSIEEDADKLNRFKANTLQYLLSDPDMFMGLLLLHLHRNPRAEDIIFTQGTKIDVYSVQKILMYVEESDPVAHVGTSSSKKKKKRGSKVVCFRCQEPGHVASKCTAPAPVP